MNSAGISIIIPCYSTDRLSDVKELLDSVQTQTFRDIQTLVVAERSRELAGSISNYIAEKSYPNMQVLYNEGPRGTSAARNLGIDKASGGYIAFVDDDAVLPPEWAEATVKTYEEDSSVIGVTGPILPLWKEKPVEWFPREFYWIFSCTNLDTAQKIPVRNGYGTNMSFRKEAFRHGERFNTSFGIKGPGSKGWQEPGAEETELSLRITQKTGGVIIFNPEVKVRHKVYGYRTKTNFIARRAYWEGYGKALLKHFHHDNGDNTGILGTEKALLFSIFFRLVPGVIKRLFKHPIIALRQLWLTAMVLACVAAGYFTYEIKRLSR